MNAKQKAMDTYGLSEWPASHMHKYPYPDCRGYACELMRESGMYLEDIALAVGFRDHKSVRDAIHRRKVNRLKGMKHIDALLSYFNQLKPIQGERT